MRILFISSSSGSRGGGELYLIYLAEALSMQGHEVCLWTSLDPKMDELCVGFQRYGEVQRADYINTYDRMLRSLSGLFRPWGWRNFIEQWRRWKPDIVHFNKQNLEDGLDLLGLAERLNLPSVCTIHLSQSAAYLGARFAWLRDAVARHCLGRYDGTFVVIQEPRLEDLRTVAGASTRGVSIHNSVSIPDPAQLAGWRQEIRQQLHLQEDQLLFVAVGRMAEQKNPLAFIDLAQQLKSNHPQSVFLWIGDGALATDWDQRVSSTRTEDFIKRLPWQNNVYQWLAAADVFLHPARYESFLPLAVLEAMAVGLPCVLNQGLIDDIPLLVDHPELVLNASQIDEWSKSLQNSDFRTAAGKRGRDLVSAEFSLARMAERYEQLYRSEITHSTRQNSRTN